MKIAGETIIQVALAVSFIQIQILNAKNYQIHNELTNISDKNIHYYFNFNYLCQKI